MGVKGRQGAAAMKGGVEGKGREEGYFAKRLFMRSERRCSHASVGAFWAFLLMLHDTVFPRVPW